MMLKLDFVMMNILIMFLVYIFILFMGLNVTMRGYWHFLLFIMPVSYPISFITFYPINQKDHL